MKLNCVYCSFTYHIEISPEVGQEFECGICGKKFLYGQTQCKTNLPKEVIHNFNYPKLVEKAINELRGLTTAILFDEKIDDTEIKLLTDWLNKNQEFINEWPMKDLFLLLNDILANGIVDDIERKRLFYFLSGISNTNDSIYDLNPEIIFQNKIFIITGEMEWSPREKAEAIIIQRGGTLSKSVIKKLDYLIVGSKGNENWKYGNYGAKIEKAKGWRSQGQNNPLIISEKDFIRSVVDN